jgi:RNA polymerase sigma factor (sigma-70 family)
MRDTEVVASIVAGDPQGLAEAYDRYAGALFSYCRSLLREPADAADAVQDTFVIAAAKLARLRDPERLRAWLFAVARNECMHRLRSRPAAPLEDIPDPVDESADVGAAAERAEARALVRAAVGGLNDRERDVINQLGHGLEVPEVAAVLGVSRNHAHALLSRARQQLEASIAVLVVGRSGRQDCAALDRLLRGWDGQLTAPLRKRVGRHINHCLVCSDRRRRELRPAMLLGLAPAAALAVSAGRDPVLAMARAISRPAAPPAGLRAEVLRLSRSAGPHAAALRSGAGRSTRPFGTNGFPRPRHHGQAGLAHRPHLPLGVAGGTAAAATATVIAIAAGPHAAHRPHTPPAPGTATATAVPAVPAPGATRPGTGPTGPGTQDPPAVAGSAAADQVRTVPARGGHHSPGPSSPAAASPPAPAASPSAPASGGGPAPAPTASPTVAVTATPTVSATSSAPAGTLTVSPAVVVLSPLLGGTLTLTANGGPVRWSISEPAALLGSLTVSPRSGTVYPGSPVTVSLSATVSVDTTLTVSPGGEAVTVLLSLGL